MSASYGFVLTNYFAPFSKFEPFAVGEFTHKKILNSASKQYKTS